ncbi:hypothetical protein [Corynebacterium bovis]|uniref:hypothetical protein n=1 Tax=Corynebacterium bovis TaxID=36808 RepID=UPI000F654822|nr:hypothetical protein [Corynebacterium bovis]
MSAEQGVLEGAVGSLAGAATALGVGGPQARRLMDAAAFTRGFDPAAVTAGIPSRRPSVGTLLTGLSEISSVVSALIDVAGTVPSGALSGASEERSEQDRRAADAERSVCSCASAMGTVQSGAVAAVESVVAGAVALCGGLGGAGGAGAPGARGRPGGHPHGVVRGQRHSHRPERAAAAVHGGSREDGGAGCGPREVRRPPQRRAASASGAVGAGVPGGAVRAGVPGGAVRAAGPGGAACGASAGHPGGAGSAGAGTDAACRALPA